MCGLDEDGCISDTVAFGYDQLGHQTRMVDGNGNTTVYGFNDWGLQDTTIEPATTTAPDLADRTWITGYDLAGNPVEQHLPGGVTQTAEYDLLGRKTTESGTGAEAATTIRHYTWDGVGNLTGFSSDLGDTTVDYNDRGLITAITGTQTSTYEYNGDGQVIERTDAAGTTAFTYDKGRLKTLTDPLTNTTNTYQWRGDGQLASITTGSATRSFTYGGYGQLTGDTLTAGSQTKSIAYTYDGQLLASTTTSGLPNAGTQTYGYDQQGRLTSWTDATGIDTTYTWDGNSNRVAVNRWDTECGDQAATTRLYVYDERNQLTEAMDGPVQCVQSGGTWQTQTTVPTANETWTYTPRGTTATHTDTEDVTTNYVFDAFEQLKTATVGSHAVVNQYDALGRLVARNGNTGFAYDGLTNNLTAAPNGSGIDRIIRDPAGGTVSQTHGGITGLSWTNTHGDLVGIINPTTGDLIAGGGLDPFGNPLPATTSSTIGFQGGYTDPTTGEVNAHARWYNPETGASTSRDTWQLSPSPVAQSNRYLYGNASPLGNLDPSGHSMIAKWDLGSGGGPVYGGGGSAGGLSGLGSPEHWENGGGDTGDVGGQVAQEHDHRKSRSGARSGGIGGYIHKPDDETGYDSDDDETGYDSDDDFYFPDPWSPWAPLVPIVVIDWNAQITRPVATALAAAVLEVAIDLLDGLLMENGEDADKSSKANKIEEAEEDNRVSIDNPYSSQDERNDRRCEEESRDQRYHYQPLDNEGRSQGADALICPSDLKETGSKRDDETKVNVYGFPTPNPDNLWHRSHILGDRFHGAWDEVNLFTGTSQMNTSGMKRCENRMADQLADDNWVIYSGELNYNNSTGIPVSITMTAYTEDGLLFQETILNNTSKQTLCLKRRS